MPKSLLLALLLFSTTAGAAPPPKPYHLELEVNSAAPFPFLRRFGTVTLNVFPAGVRAETMWLNAFSRNGAATVTVENPYGRMYTYVAITELVNILHKMSKEKALAAAAPVIASPISGKVHGIAARRYRLLYGPQAWIDVWTTTAIPENPQLRSISEAFVRGISPATAESLRSVHGTPLYVELNFQRYQKLPLVRLKSITWSNVGQEKALSVGTLYFKAPLLDSLLK